MGILILLAIIFFLSLSVALFALDLRRENESKLPWWIGLVDLVCIGSWIAILFINWKVAILGVIIYYASSFVPLPQIIGNILMSPFKSKIQK